MDATRMKRTAAGFVGGAAILLGVLGGATGAAAGGAVTLSAPQPYDGGRSGGAVVRLRFATNAAVAEQEQRGYATGRIGPTAEVA